MKIAKLIAWIGLIAMSAVLVNGFVNGNFGIDGAELLENPWGLVSFVDLYVGCHLDTFYDGVGIFHRQFIYAHRPLSKQGRLVEVLSWVQERTSLRESYSDGGSMNILSILKIIASVGTVGTGLFALIKPRAVFGFTGLTAAGGRGITEIRSILGAFFIALGVVPLYYRQPETYTMLGIAYLAVALVRLVSMFADKSVEQSNIISLIVEIVFGVILVLPN